jgi:hypothetical protein
MPKRSRENSKDDFVRNRFEKSHNSLRSSKRLKISEPISDPINIPESFNWSTVNPDTIDHTKWHSASTVHNYMLNDTILDYFKYHHESSHSKISRTRSRAYSMSERPKSSPIKETSKFENVFFNFILNQGNKFEDKVVSCISDIINSKNIKQISFSQKDIPKISKFQETIREMEKGTPIIFQGVLHSSTNNTYGSPDLMVRHDYLNRIVGDTITEDEIDEETYQDHSSLGQYHYRIIDIKFCNLNLRADGTHLLNSGRMKANKGQIMIYNRIIGEMQGYTPRYCYVMGRGFKFTKLGIEYSSDSCIDRMGRIDIEDVDEQYNKKIDGALEWLTDVKNNGHKWSLYPVPSKKELYPNMCNTYDMPYHSLKSDLADKLKDHTQIWNVGIKHRNIAHENGITRWSNITDVSELGIKPGSYTGNIVQQILDFNNSKTKKLVIPDIIENNDMNWKKIPKLEFYIDFELVNNIFDDMSQIPKKGSQQHIFMIGLVAVINKKRLRFSRNNFDVKYYDFTAESLDDESEYSIFNDMHIKIKEICDSVGVNADNVNFYHWGAIENTVYEKMLNKYDYPEEWAIGNFGHISTLCNFLDIFKSEPVLIKGVLKFGLKDVGKGLIKHNLINVKSWDDSCAGGLEAMVSAEKCYRKNKDSDESIRSFSTMKNIIKYNEVDCQMVFQIVNYLRKNHTHKKSVLNRIKDIL